MGGLEGWPNNSTLWLYDTESCEKNEKLRKKCYFFMRVSENQQHQRIPRLGSEVRFGDGITAGRIRALNDDGFVVIRGKKRVRRLIFPYDSIAAIGNRVVTLRSSKAEVLEKPIQNASQEKENTSKKQFIREIDSHLAFDNPNRAERIARITLYLLSKRLSASEKKQLKKNLPPGIRSLWAAVEQPGTGQYFNMSDFLVPIKKSCCATTGSGEGARTGHSSMSSGCCP